MKLDTVKSDVNHCLDQLAAFLDIEVGQRPEIVVYDKGLGAYSPEKNAILINPLRYGNGTVYFEEVAHALRDRVNEKEEESVDNRVDEFFGRLGEEIGRRLPGNEDFFNGNGPRRFSDHDFFRKSAGEYLDFLIELEKKNDVIVEAQNDTIDIINVWIDYSNNLNLAMRDYRESDDKEKLFEAVNQNIKEVNQKLADFNGKRLLEDYVDVRDLLISCDKGIIEDLTEAMKLQNMQENEKDEDDINYLEKMRCQAMESAYSTLEQAYDCLEITKNSCSFNLSSTFNQLKEYFILKNFVDHFYGYISAEMYMDKNPGFMEDAPALFRLPDSEIEARFMDEESFQPYMKILEEVEADRGLS